MFLPRSWGEPNLLHMMRSDKPNCGIQKKSKTKFNVWHHIFYCHDRSYPIMFPYYIPSISYIISSICYIISHIIGRYLIFPSYSLYLIFPYFPHILFYIPSNSEPLFGAWKKVVPVWSRPLTFYRLVASCVAGWRKNRGYPGALFKNISLGNCAWYNERIDEMILSQ